MGDADLTQAPLESALRRRLFLQQRRDLEAVLFQRRRDLVSAFQPRPEHRTAAIDRPAIAIYPHDIDVSRPLCLAFGEDQRAFVYHRLEGALVDIGLAALALLEPHRSEANISELKSQ